MFCVSSVNQLLSTGSTVRPERVHVDVAHLEVLVDPPVQPSLIAPRSLPGRLRSAARAPLRMLRIA